MPPEQSRVPRADPAPRMISHLSLGVTDLGRAAGFYERILAPLGYVQAWASEEGVGFGPEGAPDQLALFVRRGDASPPGPGFHLAFAAPSRAAVERFHAAAVQAGGSDAGAPGLRPHYGPTYYAAFVIDLDGHKLEAVHQTATETA